MSQQPEPEYPRLQDCHGKDREMQKMLRLRVGVLRNERRRLYKSDKYGDGLLAKEY